MGQTKKQGIYSKGIRKNRMRGIRSLLLRPGGKPSQAEECKETVASTYDWRFWTWLRTYVRTKWTLGGML